MRLRLKTYVIYTLVVLTLICLINVWMIVFVRNYVTNSGETPVEQTGDTRGVSDTNRAIRYHQARGVVDESGRTVESVKEKHGLPTNNDSVSKRPFESVNENHVLPTKDDVARSNREPLTSLQSLLETEIRDSQKSGLSIVNGDSNTSDTSERPVENVNGKHVLPTKDDIAGGNREPLTSLQQSLLETEIRDSQKSGLAGINGDSNTSNIKHRYPNDSEMQVDEINTGKLDILKKNEMFDKTSTLNNFAFTHQTHSSTTASGRLGLRAPSGTEPVRLNVHTPYNDAVNVTKDTRENVIYATNETNETNVNLLTVESHSNITGFTNITGTYVTTDDHSDITEDDDHIYLEENLDFKRMLERDSEETSIPERMWRHRQAFNTSYSDRKQVYNMYYRKIVNQGGVNCLKILDADNSELDKAREIMSVFPRRGIRPERYIKLRDCDTFKRIRGYIEHPLSESERNFPLAFGIVMYRDVEQTERLLRAIYRPHNFYCIHVDTKSDKLLKLAMERIVRCLPNVFISSKLENVTWGEFTVLQADLNCMQELWRFGTWKYYINLTGQEFPLKTNREVVKILESMDGANIVDGTWVRANDKYFYRWTSAGNRPPHGIRPVKGSVHVLVTRHFVDFCLHDIRAIEFRAWLQKTQIPDETYFASLNHNPHLGIKGSFLGETEAYPLKPAFMRYKNWEFGNSIQYRNCTGKYVRHICILGVGDLHDAFTDNALFVNKFHLNFEYLALDCLEEVLHEKTWHQYLDDSDVDVSYYRHLDYVKFKLS